MDENLSPPPGWRYAAYPWLSNDRAPGLPELVQVGPVLLPQFFHLVIATEDSWWPSRDGTEEAGPGECALFLDFQVFEGEVLLPNAVAVYDDLPRVLERVRKIVSPGKWKRLGIQRMLQYLAQFVEEGGLPDGDPTGRPGEYGFPSDPYRTPPKGAEEWLDRLQAQAADAYAEARDLPSGKRKRVRITDDHLREVAQVYRVAENLGRPPTREVANHFKTPHSTAAKWVATARRKAFLPPVGQPAGSWVHEEQNTNERRLQLEWWLKDSGARLSPEQRQAYEEELAALGGELPGRVSKENP
jgi:hypothetical protein